VLAQSRVETALAMEQRAQQTRFGALLLGAERYLDGGGELASLNVERAQQLGLLPLGWFGGTLAGSGDTNPIFHSTVLLGPARADAIEVGFEDSHQALEPIIRRYGRVSSRIYFPYPAPMTAGSTPRGPAMLVMVFARAGLARASASASRTPLLRPLDGPSTGRRLGSCGEQRGGLGQLVSREDHQQHSLVMRAG
jgi:hypothetical protein